MKLLRAGTYHCQYLAQCSVKHVKNHLMCLLGPQSECRPAALPSNRENWPSLITIRVVCIVLSVNVTLIVLRSQASSLGHSLLQGMPLLDNLPGLCLQPAQASGGGGKLDYNLPEARWCWHAPGLTRSKGAQVHSTAQLCGGPSLMQKLAENTNNMLAMMSPVHPCCS